MADLVSCCNAHGLTPATNSQLIISSATTWSMVGDKRQSIPHYPLVVMRVRHTRKGWKTMETNRATQNMAQGYVCSESVLLAACQEFEIEIDDKIIPRIAFGFAGGIGNTGAVCGAVAGAVMAIGLMKERGDTMEEGLRTLGWRRSFVVASKPR